MPLRQSSTTVETLLSTAGLMIENGQLNPEIYAELQQYGYNQERFSEGNRLLELTKHYYSEQKQAQAAQMISTAALKDTMSQAQAAYREALSIIRFAFRHDALTRQSLQANTAPTTNRSEWIPRTQAFYANALASEPFHEVLAQHGLTRIKLEQGRDLVHLVHSLRNSHERDKSHAATTTSLRNTAAEELNQWVARLRSIAKTALKAKPQLLGQLGIAAPRPRRPRSMQDDQQSL